MGDSYSFYDLKMEVEVVGGHRRRSFLLVVFNFIIKEKALEILRKPGTYCRDRNKGQM